MTTPVRNGPQAPFNNVPIHAEYYQPSDFVITAISLGVSTTITTSVNHNYVIGQLVRLHIPDNYGCIQLNEATGYVLSIPAANQVVVAIDSSLGVNQFKANPTYGPTKPQISAIGDTNSGPINTSRVNQTTFISGSFINISPL